MEIPSTRAGSFAAKTYGAFWALFGVSQGALGRTPAQPWAWQHSHRGLVAREPTMANAHCALLLVCVVQVWVVVGLVRATHLGRCFCHPAGRLQ